MSYKKRYYLLILSLPILLLGAWKLSFSQTVKVHKEYKLLKSNQLRYTNPDLILSRLQQELSSIREHDVADPDLLDQQLMEEVSKMSGPYKFRLEAFPETHVYRSENYQVQTFMLRLSGSYTNLLRFIYYSEYEIKTCRLVSVAFERKVLRKRGERLYANLYFQSVCKIN